MPAWLVPALTAAAGFAADQFTKKDRKAGFETKTVVDETKANVANPLSSFLAQSVGKGLPRYSGELAPEIDPNLTSRYNEFLSLNANDLFDKYIQQPATKAFKEDFLPTIEEGYAGGLRGSGRYRGVEDAINKFSDSLADQRYKANLEVPVTQMALAKDYYNMQDIKIQRQYKDWFQSLPENNPMLEKALQFLSEGTSSGTTLLSGLNPGQEGWFGDVLGLAGTLYGIERGAE